MKEPFDIETLELLELDTREADGITVRLLWFRGTDIVLLRVVDSRLGRMFELSVAPDLALDAFRHPFAYAAVRGALNGPADQLDRATSSGRTVA
jgi:hypothetical protein